MDKQITVTRLTGCIVVSRSYPHPHAPCYKYRLSVVDEPSTPLLNRVRHWLDMDSAQPHTVVRPTDAYIVAKNYVEKRDDPRPLRAVREYLEDNGYEIVEPYDYDVREESTSNSTFTSTVDQRVCSDCFPGYRCPDHARSLS